MKKVLIVEDSPFYSDRAKEIVEELNFKSLLAFDGKSGVEIYEKELPDYVIMDICMPIMDGLEATKVINNKYSNAKIIICSSVGHVPIYRKQAIKNGAKAFLSKHFIKKELEQVLEELNFYDN
ncbi:response regulator [Gemella sp. GH3]|uniref:response regulator n=1 Tax=unclassified Gemella TaxID=2624949 RepID=UPI0015CFFCD6|nr:MULTISPECIES: response regulator [unclassified Gemella]MBF0713836.1 response regulator [Gemella sp. GH3.1]NYS50788.1 response regulator [Gemella sp. GH3]